MLDRWSLKLIKPALGNTAKLLNKLDIKANHVTVTGFFIGMLSIPLLAFEHYNWALVALVLNRLADGLDGELARLQSATDTGAFLDIVLDFIFYSGIVFGFALANPDANALAASALIFSFMGTGASFLAFAIFAERRQLSSMTYPSKGFYYLNGITEGTETIAFFVLMCIWPMHFAIFAWIFAGLCAVTTVIRVRSGVFTLTEQERKA
ncbi:CDP-alcohol phosphatidyltransferase family protein [Reinekea marina]|uniref:CDP-alcohol phosphatidyltransferase family protein n=1 Tax=Reinekea marina TaxID=1310421 RepID=A0ABV7WM24_9GAMM|nr:CDP-alcohol phosphatidyltransferase family protein [Reinekea marina]MDN3648333.1 CDP-alcohol phosphatidyltransferase family protein [Reinekea marina]